MRFGWLGAGALSFWVSLGVMPGCSPSAPAPAHDDSPVAATAQAIQGGADDGTDHPFAVGVCNGNKNSCQGFCSGTLILPNLVVTARHCVDNTTKIIDCAQNPRFGARHQTMWITTHNKMSQNPNLGWHQVKSVVAPTDDHVCGNDIALLVLNDEVAEGEAKPAIPGVQYPMADLNRYTRRFTAVGFGNTSPQGFTAGTRRIRNDISVVCIPGDDFAPCPAGVVNDNEFIGGDGTCEGDSGSSAFEDKSFIKGAPVSFGVLSRGGESDDGLTCKGSLYTRLDKWRDLVIQAAEAASNNWTLYPKPSPDWTVYVPPPVVPDAGPKKPENLAEGTACADATECKSKVCADTGAGKACTTACDESVGCREGFVCKESVCVQDLGGDPAPVAAAPPATTTTTSGCSVGARTAGAPGAPIGALGLAAAAVIALGRRRRERRTTSR
jgi:MYXO-CTERM domain-containing protein